MNTMNLNIHFVYLLQVLLVVLLLLFRVPFGNNFLVRMRVVTLQHVDPDISWHVFFSSPGFCAGFLLSLGPLCYFSSA